MAPISAEVQELLNRFAENPTKETAEQIRIQLFIREYTPEAYEIFAEVRDMGISTAHVLIKETKRWRPNYIENLSAEHWLRKK